MEPIFTPDTPERKLLREITMLAYDRSLPPSEALGRIRDLLPEATP